MTPKPRPNRSKPFGRMELVVTGLTTYLTAPVCQCLPIDPKLQAFARTSIPLSLSNAELCEDAGQHIFGNASTSDAIYTFARLAKFKYHELRIRDLIAFVK